MYLAIGIWDDAFTCSLAVNSRDPKIISTTLYQHAGNQFPDQILLIQNDLVIEHWNRSKYCDLS